MRIYNPNKNKVEFLCGGVRYYMDAKESREFPDHIAEHALERSKVGLVVYHPAYDREMTKTDMNYPEMVWGELRSLASARKVFRPSMKRDEVERLLNDYDTKIGTLQESPNQEEGEGA